MKHIKPYLNFVNEQALNEMLKIDMKKLRALRDKIEKRLQNTNLLSLIEDLILDYQIDYYADYNTVLTELISTLIRLHKEDAAEIIRQIDQEISVDVADGRLAADIEELY